MKRWALLLLSAAPAWALDAAACKQSCTRDFRPKCEQACKDNAKNMLDECLKTVCDASVVKCQEYCEHPPPKPPAH